MPTPICIYINYPIGYWEKQSTKPFFNWQIELSELNTSGTLVEYSEINFTRKKNDTDKIKSAATPVS